jgi:hypothetical protein
MSDDDRFLLVFVLSETVMLVVLAALLVDSLLGGGDFLAATAQTVRLAALCFVTVETLIPLWVYLDSRRRQGGPDTIWVHAAAMPVVNLVGLLAYLEERRRTRDDS